MSNDFAARRTMTRAFNTLADARAERRQAEQVAIYLVARKPRKTPTTYAPADRVAETIARLESLNPGDKFETR